MQERNDLGAQSMTFLKDLRGSCVLGPIDVEPHVVRTLQCFRVGPFLCFSQTRHAPNTLLISETVDVEILRSLC